MGTIEIINPVECPQWDELVLQTDDYSFFHSSCWAEVLQRSYDYLPRYFTLMKEGRVAAMIPVMEVRSLLTGKRGVSISFADYCDPIGEDTESFNALFQHVLDFGRKRGWRHFELRGGKQFLRNAPPSGTYLCHTLELSHDEESLLSRFRHSTKVNIKKAVREGVSTQICNTLQGITEFYELQAMTRKRLGVPPQPFHFFKNIYDLIIAKNSGLVALASYRGKVIAGAVCFHFGDRAIYKYSASDRTYQQLRPNNLITWEVIRWYALHHYSTFCFGRSNYDNKGLRQYKNGWDTTEKQINYYEYNFNRSGFVKIDMGKMHMGSCLLHRVPKPVLGAIGRLFYRHIG